MEGTGENQNNYFCGPNQYYNEQNHYQFPSIVPGNPSTNNVTQSTNYVTPSTSQQPTYTNLNTNTNKSTDELLQFVLKELEDLKTSSAKLTDVVTRIDEKLVIRIQEDNFQAEPPGGFPLESMEEFEAFEEASPIRHRALQGHFEFLGGQNLKEAIGNFIRAAMTNEFARNFSWTGQSSSNDKANRALFNTKLIQTIFAAARRMKRIPKFDREEFKKNFSDVLRSYKQIALNKRNKKNKGTRNQRKEDEIALFPNEESEDTYNDENMLDV